MSDVVRRCIRSTGREFEEGFRCDDDPIAALETALAFATKLGIARACPSMHRLSETEWSVRWWSAD